MSIIKNLTILIVLSTVALFTACGGGDTPTPVTDPTQEIIDGLGKTWTISSVTLDNSDVTSDWSGFELTFNTSKGYSASDLSDESVLIWPTIGTYSFPNQNNALLVERNDGVQISISNLTETSATLSFQITGRNGRSEGLIGAWVFVMGS